MAINSTEVVLQVPDQYKSIYQHHWQTIKTNVRQGRIKDVYNFPLFTADDSEITEKVEEVIRKYDDAVKINVVFGFILKNRITNDLKFYHPSNNSMLFNSPRLLASPNHYRQFIEDVEREDVFEYVRLHRPTPKWIPERVICVRFEVYKL